MLKTFFHILVLLTLVPVLAFAQEASLPKNLGRDGHIRFYIYHTNTFVELSYLDQNGQWEPKVYDEFNFLLRSYTDDKILPIDKRLIELADHLQDHFKVDVIEVISGFRSPEYNAELKNTGHKVVNESFHTKGMAMDIHIDEIHETVLRDYLQTLGLGGVGYYGTKLMVHMDFGPVRQWEDDSFRENLNVGEFNLTLPFRMTTQKFYYDPAEMVKVGFEKLVVAFDFHQIVLQKFVHGQWQAVEQSPALLQTISGLQLDLRALKIAGQPIYGKFRLQYKKGGYWQNSNEFYVKRAL